MEEKVVFILRGDAKESDLIAKSMDGIHLKITNAPLEDKKDIATPWVLNKSSEKKVEAKMKEGYSKIVVSGKFNEDWEVERYNKLAKKHGYDLYSMQIERFKIDV